MSPIPDDPRTDAQLVVACADGEAAAFDAIYRRHRQWAYRLAYRFTGNDADAWDVVQEAFGKLVGELEKTWSGVVALYATR